MPTKTAKLIPANPKVKILSVTIKRMMDESPDTSWLGEYSDKRTSDFSIDRNHSEECAANNPAKVEAGRIWLERIAVKLEAAQEDQDTTDDATEFIYDIIGTVEDCNDDCSPVSRRELQYFNPSFNYVTKDGKPADGLSPEDVRKYTRQDYERMESLNAGRWSFVSIGAEAEIAVKNNFRNGKSGEQCATIQRITSGYIGGIESDSDREDLKQTSDEQLAELKTQLRALGLSSRAISHAFKNVKTEGN